MPSKRATATKTLTKNLFSGSPVRVTHSTELMYTYRNARPMRAPQMVKALEDRDGQSLLLSVGDGVLACTRESLTEAQTWVQTDLGSKIGESFPGQTIRARLFDAVQDPVTQKIDLAVVVSDQNADYLFVSFDNPAPDAAIPFLPVWRAVTLKDPTIQTSAGAAPLVIADLVNLGKLVGRLLKPALPIDTWLAGQLEAKDRAILQSYSDKDPDSAATRLTAVLNGRIAGGAFYEDKLFARVELRTETQELLKRGAAIGNDLAYLNRLLLEDAYQVEIARNRYVPGPLQFHSLTSANPSQGPKSIIVDLLRSSNPQTGSFARFVVVPAPGPTPAKPKPVAEWKHYPLPYWIGGQSPVYRINVSGRQVVESAFSTLFAYRAGTGNSMVTLQTPREVNGVWITPLDFNRNAPYPTAMEFHADSDRRFTAVAMSQPPGRKELRSDLLLVDEPTRPPVGPFSQAAGLLFLPNGASKSRASFQRIHNHPLFSMTRSLHVHNTAALTVVLGVTWQRELYCLECPAGSEGDPEAWSEPAMIAEDVTQIACHPRTRDDGATVIFASKLEPAASRLVQLIRDTRTNRWQLLPVLLASADGNDLYPTVQKIGDDQVIHGEGGVTYSTRISVTSDQGQPVPNLNLSITSDSLCSVLINNRPYRLGNQPVEVSTDALGTLNIVQEIDSIGSFCYTLVTPHDRPIGIGPFTRHSTVINPMAGTLDQLSAVRSADDLPLLSVPSRARGASGGFAVIVDFEAIAQQRAAAAQAIVELVQLKQWLPSDDGKEREQRSAKAMRSAGKGRHFGITYTSGGAVFHTDPPVVPRGSGLKSLKRLAGDCVRMLKHAWHKVESFVVSVIDNVIQFTVTIAGEIIQFVVQHLHEIMHGIDFVLQKVGISLPAVVKWLGKLFGWNDIVLNQKALAKMVSVYADRCVGGLNAMGQRVSDTIDGFAGTVRKWGGKPPTAGGNRTAFAGSTPPSLDLPSSHWASHTFIHHLPHLRISAVALDASATTAIQDALRALADQLRQDWGAFKQATLEMSDLAKALPTMPLHEVLKKLLSLVTVDLLNLTKRGLMLAIKLFQALGSLVRKVLDAPIHMPVFSRLYREFTGEDLTLLNLICLVGAFAVTLIGKAMTGQDPMQRYANAILRASDFAGIQAVFASGSRPRSREAAKSTGRARPGTRRSLKAPEMKVSGVVAIGNILGFVGGTLMVLSMPVKIAFAAAPGGEDGIPLVHSLAVGTGLSAVNVLCSMPSLLGAFAPGVNPTSATGGIAVTNTVLASLYVTKVLTIDVGLSVVKAVLSLTGPPWDMIGSLVIDYVSNNLDHVIGLLSLVPTVGSVIADQSIPTWMNFGGGLLYCTASIISPLFWYAQAVVALGQVVATVFLETVQTGAGAVVVLVGVGIWAGGTAALTLIGTAQAVCMAGYAGLLMGSSYV